MKNILKKLLHNTSLFFIINFIIFGCSQEKFGQKRIVEKGVSKNFSTFNLNRCAAMTPIRPQVDLLFIVDNSASTFQISEQIKNQIQKTVQMVGQHFDYHILLAPLLPLPNEVLTNFQLMVYSLDSIPNPVSVNIISIDQLASNQVNFFQQVVGSNQEHGFKRALDIIAANRSNNIFRQYANTLVVMISNGDDNDRFIYNGQYPSGPIDNRFWSYFEDLKKLTHKWFVDHLIDPNNPPISNPLLSTQLRFISIVAHSKCGDYLEGVRYKEMSKQIYSYNGSGNGASLDSYDICGNDFEKVFTNINKSISLVADGHIYDYWPVNTASGSAQIQASEIKVSKLVGNTKIPLTESASNGWEYLGYTTQKIRRGTQSDPNLTNDPNKRAEEVTAHMIKLNGSAIITYPECILAQTQTPYEYFGYVAIPRKPKVSSIKLSINGKNISKSDSNGWSYIGYSENLNIKVPGPTNQPIIPAVNQSGYFLKLNGSGNFYSHGTEFSISYLPED